MGEYAFSVSTIAYAPELFLMEIIQDTYKKGNYLSQIRSR